ncbi:MAG: DEAD/DEAH box helicase, partial [Pseudoxanthomonas sp.]
MEAPLLDWFKTRGWKVLPFQHEVWTHYLEGRSGLLHTPTGSGKTLAAFGGPLLDAVRERQHATTALKKNRVRPLQVLWITPLKALAADTTRALNEAIAGVGLDWQVGQRTGDASARDKRLARAGKLDVLVTTPESLALLLSYPDTAPQLQDIRAVIVDEWHELLANKRGVLLQLGLARLRRLSPGMRTWGLSATLGNLDEARDALLPDTPDASMVAGVRPRTLTLETLRPKAGERFPWSGHLGLAQLSRVLDKLLAVKTSLLFTNTRA